MPIEITNRSRPEYTGAMMVRFFEVDVVDYDDEGEELTPTDLGFDRIQRLDVSPSSDDVFAFSYDIDAHKLYLDISGGQDVSMVMEVKGRG